MNERSPIEHGVVLGHTNWRNIRRPIAIPERDRFSHQLVLGATGTGKSTLLFHMLTQDIGAGRGVLLLDPHGDLAEAVLAAFPKRRGVLEVDIARPGTDFGLNPLLGVPPSERSAAAAGILDVFRKLWPDFWGPRTEHILRSAILVLLERPGSSLADIPRLFSDTSFRRSAATLCTNETVRHVWLHEFEGYSSRLRSEAVAPIENKLGAFLADPRLRRLLSAQENSLSLRAAMETGQALVVNLSKGRLGQDASNLLGSLLLSEVGRISMARASVPETNRKPFFVYVDEFQNFATLALAGHLSELRKYRVGFVLTQQYLAQTDLRIRDAILGNVGNTVCFRLGLSDAELIEERFWPAFTRRDIASLPNYHLYARLLEHGEMKSPMSGTADRL